jgi:copper homeostasis protein
MIEAVTDSVSIPVFVIIRPRGGGFVYTAAERDVMMRDVAASKRLGVDGLVFGALTTAAEIDVAATRALVDAAGDTSVTFHRAFDLVADLTAAFDALIALGVARLLTSGGAATALEGVASIGDLVERSAGRMVVMAAGGLREENIARVVEDSGVSEVHVRGTRLVGTASVDGQRGIRLRKALPEDEGAWEATDEARIRALVALATGKVYD